MLSIVLCLIETDHGSHFLTTLKSVVCPYDKIFPAEDYEKDVDDNCKLFVPLCTI